MSDRIRFILDLYWGSYKNKQAVSYQAVIREWERERERTLDTRINA